MIENRTVADLVAVGAAFCLFGLFVFIPGYVLGWLLNLLEFRKRSVAGRLALSTPLSIALCPILSYLLGRGLSMTAVWAAFAALWIGFLLLLLPARARPWPPKRSILLPFAALALAWVVVGALSLVDVQIGDRLYLPASSFDYCLRTAFISAISNTGIPPQSPLFLPGHPVLLRYHYFWLILCSLVDQSGRGLVGPHAAMIAGALWSGLGLMSVIAIYLRWFGPLGARNLNKKLLCGIALLGVTGLDIVPTAVCLLLYVKGIFGFVSPSVERWNNQIDGWFCTMLWEPHYLAGLVACLTGFLIVYNSGDAKNRAGCLIAGLAAGAAFATAVGTSVYIALVFAIFLVAWTAVTLAKRWHRETAVLAIAGVTALALSIPFLRSLSGPAAGGSLVQLTVRSFFPAEGPAMGLGLTRRWQLAIVNGLFLPLNYFLELGFFFVIGCLAWKEFRRHGWKLERHELAALVMLGSSVTVCTFLRSGVIVNNDLGWRGFLIAQFVLLIWGADYLAGSWVLSVTRRQRVLLTALLVLGASGNLYELVMQRSYIMLVDKGAIPRISWLPSEAGLARRAYANRVAYEWLQHRTLPSAVLQQNPDIPIQDTYYLAYGDRRTVVADLHCGAGFGGDPSLCPPLAEPLKNLFSADPAPGALESVCSTQPIAFLVAKDTDQAWTNKRSWVWTTPPAFANDFVRVIPCGSIGRPK